MLQRPCRDTCDVPSIHTARLDAMPCALHALLAISGQPGPNACVNGLAEPWGAKADAVCGRKKWSLLLLMNASLAYVGRFKG